MFGKKAVVEIAKQKLIDQLDRLYQMELKKEVQGDLDFISSEEEDGPCGLCERCKEGKSCRLVDDGWQWDLCAAMGI